jgi:DNA-binding PadR family transcriptional regulator
METQPALVERMTNTELAVLGLVAEQPGYGYQIEQVIEARGMRAWTEIGFSSIYYVLNKLESAGWLESEKQPEQGGPPRKVYRLTAAGRQAYREAVQRRLSDPRQRSGDFDLALANLPALSAGEARAALELYLFRLNEQIAGVRAKQQADAAAAERAGWVLPAHVHALFQHTLTLMEAERAWVADYLSRIPPSGSQRESPKERIDDERRGIE